MDKKIILVLLIFLVLAIYYCYTHESFTENFESGSVGTDTTTAITNLGKIAAQLLAGGATVPGNLTVSGEIVTPSKIYGGVIGSRNSKDGFSYQMFATQATDTGVTPSALDLHAYNGSGSWMAHLAAFRNNGTTDLYGPVNTGGKLTVAGRDILAELDALKASIAALQASTIKDQDTIDLRNTKRFTPDGRLEYTAPGSGSSVFVANNSGPLSSENRADYYVSQFRISRNTK